MLEGVLPVLAMPFTAGGDIHQEDLRRETEWALGHGVDGLALALASEMPRLSEAERDLATRVVAEQAGGRAPLVVHVGAESGRLAGELARRAEAAGAAAVMLPAPRFEVGGLPGLRAFVADVAAATTLDVVLQDLPSQRIEPALVRALRAAHGRRFLLKVEAPPTPAAVAAGRAELGDDVPILGGAGGLSLLSELTRGVSGTMPGCVLPELFVAVVRRFRAGDEQGAYDAYARLAPFLAATSLPGVMLTLYREALVLRGVFEAAHGRSPAAEASGADRRDLAALLDALDLEVAR